MEAWRRLAQGWEQILVSDHTASGVTPENASLSPAATRRWADVACQPFASNFHIVLLSLSCHFAILLKQDVEHKLSHGPVASAALPSTRAHVRAAGCQRFGSNFHNEFIRFRYVVSLLIS